MGKTTNSILAWVVALWLWTWEMSKDWKEYTWIWWDLETRTQLVQLETQSSLARLFNAVGDIMIPSAHAEIKWAKAFSQMMQEQGQKADEDAQKAREDAQKARDRSLVIDEIGRRSEIIQNAIRNSPNFNPNSTQGKLVKDAIKYIQDNLFFLSDETRKTNIIYIQRAKSILGL